LQWWCDMARLDFHDLIVRNFVRSHLPPFTGFCTACDDYRTFGWWASPYYQAATTLVSVCQSCKVVAKGDERLVHKHPVIRQARAS
jgi:hypothetical protein